MVEINIHEWRNTFICLLYSMQSKSPNTVNKVVEEVPSVGCTIVERRGHCPCCPTQFLQFTSLHRSSIPNHSLFIQSAWLATLLSMTSPRTYHMMCFSNDVAPPYANTTYRVLKISQHYFFCTGCWRNVTGWLPILFTTKLSDFDCKTMLHETVNDSTFQ